MALTDGWLCFLSNGVRVPGSVERRSPEKDVEDCSYPDRHVPMMDDLGMETSLTKNWFSNALIWSYYTR